MRIRLLAGVAACLLAASNAPVASGASTTLPAFGHVFVIVMENHEYSQIIGSGDAPYINQLANTYGLATNYTAIRHPSQPNYLALWSGSTQGVTDDRVHDITARTLGSQMGGTGRSWRVAAQNVPLNCYTSKTASGGEDGVGTYSRNHEPAISFTSVSGNAARCARRITDFTHFDPAVGDLWFVAPNDCNDMHDCSVATGDAFLAAFVPTILQSAAYQSGAGLVVITWDEGETRIGGGGQVATIMISPRSKPAYRSPNAYNHYSVLRTIEDAWGLPCLANSCTANNMAEFFQ